MTSYEEETILKRARRFLCTNKFPAEKQLFGDTVHASLLRYDFVVKVVKNGRREV